MQQQQAVKNVLAGLNDSLYQLTDAQYNHPSKILFSATIGQHVRHIIEFFICLKNGYETGVVNYEKRKRDLAIETSRDLAIRLLKEISVSVERKNRSLLLESNEEGSEEGTIVVSNYYREIIYNIEHTIHHMALIRIGINEVSKINVPEDFGVASSTMKYRKECAR